MTIIDKAEAARLLEQQIAKKGQDFAFPRKDGMLTGCQYFNGDGSPCCIVGHAFDDLGVTWEQLGVADYNSVSVEGLDDSGILLKLGIDLSDEAMELWSNAQRYQDRGETWGDAVLMAKQEVGLA